jgi:hypothetical protein
MHIRPPPPPIVDRPVLRLGLAGFNNAEQAHLKAALVSRAARYQMNWELSSLGDADAWCVNGAHVQGLPDGTLRVTPGLPSGRSIRINPAEIDWPVAFSTPLDVPGFQPAYAFEPQVPASVGSVLTQLEGWLRPLMVQFHLAAHIVEQDLDLRSAVFHVTVNGKLYAIVSRRVGIGVWPIADPAEMPHAIWSHRPGMADTIPSHFIRTDFSQLMWQFATRTSRDCLPSHYRTRRLYLRRAPRLPMRLVNDACLLLVSELGNAPGTMSELAQRSGMPEPQLARHLGALYMVGSITADPKRAAVPRAAVDSSDGTSAFDSTNLSAPGSAELTVKLTQAAGRPPRDS